MALPLGGEGAPHHAVMEMHYDNPDMLEGVRSNPINTVTIAVFINGIMAGVMDSSGMRFYYSSTSREHDAGIMFLGHDVTSYMVIPPGTSNYTIGGICTANCTKSVCRFVCNNIMHVIIHVKTFVIMHTYMSTCSTSQMVASESLPTFCTLILLVCV